MTIIAVLIYLSALTIANLLAARYGPAVTILNALVLIALDLTLRDVLHDRWRGRGLWVRMVALIVTAGMISWWVNHDAGRIAAASCVAFIAAGLVDALVYRLLERHPRLVRANGSNVPAALVDSVLFPTLAFGAVLPWITAGQFLVKVAGGAVWSLLLYRFLRPERDDAVPVRRVGA